MAGGGGSGGKIQAQMRSAKIEKGGTGEKWRLLPETHHGELKREETARLSRRRSLHRGKGPSGGRQKVTGQEVF